VPSPVPLNLLHTNSNVQLANFLATVIMTLSYTVSSHYNCQFSCSSILFVSYQIISPSPRFCEIFRNILSFYVELLATHTNPRLEEHPSVVARDCSLNTFAATLHIWTPFLHPQSKDAPCCGDSRPLTMGYFIEPDLI